MPPVRSTCEQSDEEPIRCCPGPSDSGWTPELLRTGSRTSPVIPVFRLLDATMDSATATMRRIPRECAAVLSPPPETDARRTREAKPQHYDRDIHRGTVGSKRKCAQPVSCAGPARGPPRL